MIFLKLGGSLITDKTRPERVRTRLLRRLVHEIRQALDEDPDLRLLVGHGSGSFGHTAAARHPVHRGARTPQDWRGFVEVWRAANRLNRLVVDALAEAGVPAVAFPPSAAAVAEAGRLADLPLEPLQRALEAGLVPVVQGDVAFDRRQGAAILSTEAVFRYLAVHLRPKRVLLAGEEAGVYADYPARRRLLRSLTADDLDRIALAGARGADVTGGMAAKVRAALEIARATPGAEVRIFSARRPGALRRALQGAPLGTRVVG